MLIAALTPEIFLSPCDFSSEAVNVTGRTPADLGPLMPYLNALYPKAEYNHEARILRFRFEGHPVTLQPHEIKVGGLVDGDAAVEALYRLQAHLNEVWERRGEIEPSTIGRQRLKPLEVYQLLPRTNCRACGEPTCFVFAAKLATHQVTIKDCPPLCQDPLYADKRQALGALLDRSI